MAKKQPIPPERLKELLHYDPKTGVWTWRVAHNNRCPIGSVAGWWSKGYRYLTIDRKKIAAHIAAWVYIYGEYPVMDLDHQDGNSANNRIANLRLASHSQNMFNSRKRRTNKSGFKGVHWHSQRQKWTSQIRKNGKVHYLGLFSTAFDAHAAYASAAIELHGEFARP